MILRSLRITKVAKGPRTLVDAKDIWQRQIYNPDRDEKKNKKKQDEILTFRIFEKRKTMKIAFVFNLFGFDQNILNILEE